jgi:hypothetical protein
MRLLLIAERAEYRLLVRKHVEIDWPEAVIVEHRLGEDAAFEAQFAAAGFDAAVLIAAPPTARAELLAADLLARPEFAPIVFVLLEDAPLKIPAVPGLQRLYGRRVDRAALLRLLAAAAREQFKVQALRRSHPAFAERYRFGAVSIRGHRCLRQVGSGGMCEIYLAESERAGMLVVLKVFSQVPDVSERFVGFDRFLQEYEIVARLTHRNIVRIYALGVADDHAYIAMEHFPAGDLRQRMKAPISAAEALHCLEQMASGLAAVHDVGVLHRDLKPANVMLRTDGSLCLIDFGLAKVSEMQLELTGSREIFGTPYYMSPEQGHAEALDARSDLYSLGVILFEMLTGRKPYTGASAMEVIYKHKRAELPALGPQFAPYAKLLERLLAKSPADRFQSAHELLHAIARLKVSA